MKWIFLCLLVAGSLNAASPNDPPPTDPERVPGQPNFYWRNNQWEVYQDGQWVQYGTPRTNAVEEMSTDMEQPTAVPEDSGANDNVAPTNQTPDVQYWDGGGGGFVTPDPRKRERTRERRPNMGPRSENNGRGRNHSNDRFVEPTVSVSQPNVQIASPRESIGQPTIGIGQPTIGIGQPTIGIGQPTIGIGQPTIGIGQPTIGIGRGR